MFYLFGGIFLYLMFFLNTGPDNGWFSYVPLAGPEYGPGKRADVWAQLITFTELSALVIAIELIYAGGYFEVFETLSCAHLVLPLLPGVQARLTH